MLTPTLVNIITLLIIPPPLWTILPSVVWFVWQLIYTPRLWITLLFNTIFIFYIHISKLWTKIKIIHPSHDWNIRYVYISKVITKNLKILVVTGNRNRAEFWFLNHSAILACNNLFTWTGEYVTYFNYIYFFRCIWFL